MKTRKFSVIGFVALLILLFGVNTVFARMTASNLIRTMWGNKRVRIFDVAFDSSYDYGGEDLTQTSGISPFLDNVDTAIIYGSGNYSFKYDAANNKIKVFGPAPPIIYEERHNATGGTSGITAFTLNYPAAFIVNMVNTGGTNYPIVYSGTTNHQESVATLSAPIQDDVRTGVSVVNGTYLVTYATQAWADIHGLLVQNQLLDMASGSGITRYTYDPDLGITAGVSVFGWGWAKYDGELSGATPIDYSDTAALTSEIGVDFQDGWDLDSSVTQSAHKVVASSKTMYATYLRWPLKNKWLQSRWLEEATTTSGTSTVLLDRPLLLWLTSGYAFNNGSASLQIVQQDQAVFYHDSSQGGVSGVSEIKPNWGFRGSAPDLTSLAQLLTDEQVWQVAEGSVAIENAVYLYGHPWEIPNLRKLEMQEGSNLSNLTGVKVMLIGR